MKLKQFEKQSYLNIETFRKSGQGVKTPAGLCRIETRFTSGPRHRQARPSGFATMPLSTSRLAPPLATCLAHGSPPAHRLMNHPMQVKHVTKLMKKKYGFMFSAFGFLGRLRMRGGAKYTAIKIQALLNHHPTIVS